jgi:hypothetical protein
MGSTSQGKFTVLSGNLVDPRKFRIFDPGDSKKAVITLVNNKLRFPGVEITHLIQ